ncbi:MAG: serine/threonine protein kinase, partial [Acidobacteriota bacterium]
QMMLDSPYLVKIFDLAHSGDHRFIIREYLPLSLDALLSGGEVMPVSLAVHLGYQILNGIGDLHLQMGRDEQIRRLFHLDLRPSRILLREDRPVLKIANGGLWKVLEECEPRETALKKLPLPFLAYRAPEQFRRYLSRKRPPFFTDIYLFGMLLYEMLVGSPAFRASSYEEYEIQHCEQYPTPPKVWRPEIPEELNGLIMRCLECDPMKRWRSATEMALTMEKSFYQAVDLPRDDKTYASYLERSKKV